jgi:benzoylformate decarboxylase
MTTVREVAYDLFRRHGMTTVFGNPGSTELPMLGGFPEDFRYVLGLQEAVVVGMADGYAQASGRVAHANLHTAPGVGNAAGALFNAQANKAPLLVTAGQQSRSLMTMGANLTNRDATEVPRPFVKSSFEPPRAQDVPHALSQAIHRAALPPRGPAFVSVPMDDWDADADPDSSAHHTGRAVTSGLGAARGVMRALGERLAAAERPALVAGPDGDAAGAWDAAVALAEAQRLPVWATPAPGGGRIGFPEDHPAFQGVLPPAVGPLGEVLGAYDLVVTVGTSVFPYYPDIPGALLAEGTALVAITSDPDEAARAPLGDAVVAGVREALEALAEAAGTSGREAPPARPAPEAVEETSPLAPGAVHRTLAAVFPADGIVVLESPSSTLALRNQLRLGRPGSYYFAAGGGLGFGLAAAVGVQLAEPSRPVVCVVGEGSAQYAVTAFWTAAAYRVPVTFLVLRNDEYAILKWFGALEQVTGAPGLDLPGLDTAATAESYGVPAVRVEDRDALEAALREALAAGGPRLVEVGVAPGMALA